jgi:hypothetical protein
MAESKRRQSLPTHIVRETYDVPLYLPFYTDKDALAYYERHADELLADEWRPIVLVSVEVMPFIGEQTPAGPECYHVPPHRGFYVGQQVKELDWPHAVGTIQHIGYADGHDNAHILVGNGIHIRTLDLIRPLTEQKEGTI